MTPMTPIIILAGGKSRRMGRDKLELSLDGRTLLESIVSRFAEVFDDLYLSVADADKYADVKLRRVVDIFPGAGPLSGLHAALANLPGNGVFLVAADLPYACPYAAKRIIELCGDNDVCIVRLPDGRLEPLFGYYSKALLPLCEKVIESGDYRMTEVIFGARARFVDPYELGALWNENIIMNVNFPEDYEKLEKIMRCT
jgi:molybdopterin-guanine dinucleotide biosynthesis protein A